jgi:hypothetical protein
MKWHIAIAVLVSIAMGVVAIAQSTRTDSERASVSDGSPSCERQERR